MSEVQRKPGVAFWGAIALLVLLVGYPLSIGPACWLVKKNGLPETALVVYRPLSMSASISEKTYGALIWYIELWSGPIEEERLDNLPLAPERYCALDHFPRLSIRRNRCSRRSEKFVGF